MEFKVEQMSEKNMYRLIIEATKEEFEKGVQKAYEKNKSKITLPGFRKGKAPRKMIEKMYGESFFYNDAVENVVPPLYEEAASKSGLDIVAKPNIKVVKMDKDNPLVFTAEVAVKPEVVLGEYKGMEVEKQEVKATKEEIDEELNKIRNTNARIVEVTDRPVQDKDLTTIDFEGFIDGVAFEGGKGTNYPLTIGSHTFIDTFEDQMIGMNIGETKEVNVRFPDEYHATALKGKEAVFKVTIKEIKERQLPDLDDEFAKDVSEFDTIKEYTDSIKEQIENKKQLQAKNLKERQALDKAIENAQVDVPAPMLDAQVKNMANDLHRNLTNQGMRMEDYLKYMGLTEEKFMENLKPDALKRIKQRLILEAIAVAEKLEATDEEYEAEVKKTADTYKIEVEELKKMLGDDVKNIRSDVLIRKALEVVYSSCVEVEKKEQVEEKNEVKEAKKECKTTKKCSTKDKEETKKTTKCSSKKADKEVVEEKNTTKKCCEKDADVKKKATKKCATKAEKEEKEVKKTVKKTTKKRRRII